MQVLLCGVFTVCTQTPSHNLRYFPFLHFSPNFHPSPFSLPLAPHPQSFLIRSYVIQQVILNAVHQRVGLRILGVCVKRYTLGDMHRSVAVIENSYQSCSLFNTVHSMPIR